MNSGLRLLLAGTALALAIPTQARAWSIGSELDNEGCHEKITAKALSNVRAMFSSIPRISPTRDERALIADVQFAPPADLLADLGGMALLLAVRDNDLKGTNPLSSYDLIQVHGDPETQDEHCIRSQTDDDAGGLAGCIAFIRGRAIEALDGLDANGTVDVSKRMPLKIFVSIAGEVSPELPVFYVKMGQALHALEDGFTHTYRNGDGSRVTVMLNWIDFVGADYDESRDGPPHRGELDQCQNHVPTIDRNFGLAVAAATELLGAAADPSLSRTEKIARFDATLTKYFTFEPGCTDANDWCSPPEASVPPPPSGCSVHRATDPFAILLVIGAVLLARRRRGAALALSLAVLAIGPRPALAQNKPEPGTPGATGGDAPAVPVQVTNPEESKAAATGKEPGREEDTPTVETVKQVREDKKLGSALGFAVSTGVSFYRGAGVARIGARYRISERFTMGIDGEWNPWITTAPFKVRAGAANTTLVGILRFPMRFDRVNLRSTVRLGVSTLLFDVYGAPKYSVGPFGSISLIGIDYDLGGSVRIVFDPAEIAVAVPEVGDLPLVYEQFRFMIGLQIGA